MAFVQSANDPYSSLGPNAAALAKDYGTTGNQIIEVTTQTRCVVTPPEVMRVTW